MSCEIKEPELSFLWLSACRQDRNVLSTPFKDPQVATWGRRHTPPTPPHPPDSGRRGSGDTNNQTGPGHIYTHTHTHTDSHTNTRVSLRRIKLWNCPERWSFKACMFGQAFLTNAGSCQSKLIIQWQSRSSTTTGILCRGQTGKKSQKCFREFLFFKKEIVKWGGLVGMK